MLLTSSKKTDFVNPIDKPSQEFKDLLKPCINTTEKTTANASDDYESCLRVLESRVTALEEENKQLKEALKMPTYAGVTAVAPQAEPAASDGAQPLPPPQGAPQARGAQGLQARQGEPSAFLYAQGVANWSLLDNPRSQFLQWRSLSSVLGCGCPDCGKGFAQKCSFRTPMKRVHRELE